MAGHPPRPHPPGKSKTDLRRGHLTRGHPAAARAATHPAPKATTNAEQALLFDEPPGGSAECPHAARKHH